LSRVNAAGKGNLEDSSISADSQRLKIAGIASLNANSSVPCPLATVIS
jgi:hypothetical protein